MDNRNIVIAPKIRQQNRIAKNLKCPGFLGSSMIKNQCTLVSLPNIYLYSMDGGIMSLEKEGVNRFPAKLEVGIRTGGRGAHSFGGPVQNQTRVLPFYKVAL